MNDDFDEEVQPQWWAYRHINGGIHVKSFTLQDDLESAYDSDFVDEVLDPYPAENRAKAEEVAIARLKKS